MKMNWILLGVVLMSFEILIGLEVCLINGKYNYEGWVEVNYNGIWRVVCDYGWDRKVVWVVCCMFGYFDVLCFIKGWVSVFLNFFVNFGCLKMDFVSFIVKIVYFLLKVYIFKMFGFVLIVYFVGYYIIN